MYILYDNKAASATVTSTSEDSDFPDDNAIHSFRTKVWKTAGATAGTANLNFDFGAATNVNCCALINYDWTEQPGTLRMEFDDASDYSSIDATETLTWVANPTNSGNRGTIIKIFSSTHNYRYARLKVVYSPGATPTDWELGYIFLGTYFQPTQERTATGSTELLIDNSYNSYTAGGQRHSDIITSFRQKDVSFIVDGNTQRRLFQTFYNNNLTTRDMFVAFDYSNDPGEETYYCTLNELPSAQRVPSGTAANDYFNVNLSFRESV